MARAPRTAAQWRRDVARLATGGIFGIAFVNVVDWINTGHWPITLGYEIYVLLGAPLAIWDYMATRMGTQGASA